MPILSMETMIVPPVERPDSTHTTLTVPLRCNGTLAGTVHRPVGPPVLHPFQKPVRFNDVYLDDHVPSEKKLWKGDDIFEYLRGRSRVGLSKWQKILGELPEEHGNWYTGLQGPLQPTME